MPAVVRVVAAVALAVAAVASTPAGHLVAQAPGRDALLEAAREIMTATSYASLATVDLQGRPAIRAMDAMAPDEGMVVWLATNPRSGKVAQIRVSPSVALHYLHPAGSGYVTLVGTARLVDDVAQKSEHWKDAWTPFYPDRDEGVLLIAVSPSWIEVVSVPHGASGDPDTWRANIVEFVPGSSGR
jgi:general stress protein 26